jgi:hypothetical protein
MARIRAVWLCAVASLLAVCSAAAPAASARAEGAGKSETVNLLSEWMDPRHLHVHAFSDASDEERERPRMWRFWRVLPPKGKVSVLFGSWYTLPILQRAKKSIDDAALDQAMDQMMGRWREGQQHAGQPDHHRTCDPADPGIRHSMIHKLLGSPISCPSRNTSRSAA